MKKNQLVEITSFVFILILIVLIVYLIFWNYIKDVKDIDEMTERVEAQEYIDTRNDDHSTYEDVNEIIKKSMIIGDVISKEIERLENKGLVVLDTFPWKCKGMLHEPTLIAITKEIWIDKDEYCFIISK